MEQFVCARCGQVHKVVAVNTPRRRLSDSAWRAQMAFTMKGENAASLQVIPQERYTPVVQPGAYVETPVAQQTIENNVKVPLATALISGAFIGLASACAWAFFGLPKPLAAVPGITFMSTWWSWRGSLGFARTLLTKVEDFVNVDLNRDGQVGSQPAPTPQIERGLMVYGADGQGRLLLPDLPRYQVLQMARRMAVRFLAGRLPDNVRRNVSKRNLGLPFGDYLGDVQATLLELGLAKLGGNNTHELTDLGADWLAEVLENA